MRLHRIAQQGQDSEVWLCEADPCTHESILLDNDDNQATRRLYTSVVRADCTIVGWVEQGRPMVGITSTPPYPGAKGQGWAVPWDEWNFVPANGKAGPARKQRAHAMRDAEEHARAMYRPVVECPECDGTGTEAQDETVMLRNCPTCGGSGRTRITLTPIEP